MMDRNPRSNVASAALLTAVTLMLCGGCVPIGEVELETFMIEILRNATAAFLL